MLQPSSSRKLRSVRRSRTLSPALAHAVTRYCVEALERRVMLSVSAPGIASWVEQGPGPVLHGDGSDSVGPGIKITGSVQAIAADPNDANHLVAATVDGGMWVTQNALAADPTWTPTTDQFTGHALGDLNYSLLPGDTTLWAASASFSAGPNISGSPRTGLLKSVDGGHNWIPLATAPVGLNGGLRGADINDLVASAATDSVTGKQIILVGTTTDVFRSIDGGVTFNEMPGLPAAVAVPFGSRILVSDPGNPRTFYVTVPNDGVYATFDAGDNWVPISNLLMLGLSQTSNYSAMSVHNSVGNNWLYVGIWQGQNLTGLFRMSPTNVGLWTTLPLPAGASSFQEGVLRADPIDPDVLYIGGGPWGSYRADFTPSAGRPVWQPMFGANDLTGGGANGTSPHADIRDLEIDRNGDLLAADDGGIHRLTNPNSTSRAWSSVDGNLADIEATTFAYNHRDHVFIASTWDNGINEQTFSGSTTWDHVMGGDGLYTAVDNLALPAVQYGLGNNLTFLVRWEYKAPPNQHSRVLQTVQLRAPGNTTDRSGLNAADRASTAIATRQIVPNFVAANRLIVAYFGLYESINNGDTINEITPVAFPAGHAFTTVSYGGGAASEVIYVSDGPEIYVRRAGAAVFTPPQAVGFTRGFVKDIVVDPIDWQIAYALVSGGHVYKTIDGGTSWSADLGGTTLPNLLPDARTIELIRSGANSVLLIGGEGGVYRAINPVPGAVWSLFGTLPSATVIDLKYDATDNLLGAATYGRGIWTVPNVLSTVFAPSSFTITGGSLDDQVHIYRDQQRLIVEQTLGGVVQAPLSYIYSAIPGILVSLLGGNDSLTVDFSGGNPVPPGGISYDGGTDTTGDSFTILGSAGDDVIHEANATFSVNGSANIVALNVERDSIAAGDGNDTVDLDSVNVPTFVVCQDGSDTVNVALAAGNLDFFGAINVTGGAGNDQVILWDQNAVFSDGWTFSSGFISRAIFAGINYGVGGTVENVTVHGGPLGDDYQINGSLAGTTVTVIGGPGSDLFRFSPVAHDITSAFGGPIIINGGTGPNDQLVFSDQATSLDRNWTITSSTVDKANAFPAAALCSYSNLDGVSINGGGGSTTYTVQSANTPVTINAGGGDDRVEIGVYGAGNLDFISAPVTVDGGIGGNSLYVEDSSNTFSNTWGIGFNSITRTSFGGLSFFNFGNVVVDAYGLGGSGSLFTITGIGFASTQIFAGPGADVFNIGNGPTFIASLLAPLTIDGGSGFDTLNLLDQPDTNDTAYTISPAQVTRVGSIPITYTALEAVSVQAGSGANAFTINGTVAATPVTLSGGSGNDTFSITPASSTLTSLLGDLTIDGTTGANDQMFLSDQLNTGLLGNTFYNITPNSVQATFSAVIHFTNLDGFTLNASDGVSSLNLSGTAIGTPVTINGGNGADQLTVAGAGLLADVTYDGGEPSVAPGDSLVVNGGGLTGMYLPSATSAGGGIVSVGARLINFRKLEPVSVSDFASFTLQTQNSSDNISINSGFGNIATGTSGGVAIESLTWAGVTNFILDLATHDGAGGGSMNDLAIIQSPGLFVPEGGSFLFKGGGGNDKLIVNAGSYTFNQDASLYTANLTVVGNTGSSIRFNSDQHLAGLTLNGGGAKLSAIRHSMYVNALTISPTGLLDIANNFLYLDNTVTSFATAKAYLDAAYNLHGASNPNAPLAGDYNGTGGITSSLAQASYAGDLVVGIGYYDGALQDPANPDTVGQILGPDSNSGHGTGIPLNQILIRPTLTGDLNGDGLVNAYDVNLFNSYGLFNTGPTPLGWQAGDLNGDGIVDSKDVTVFNTVGNFNVGAFPPPPVSPSIAKRSSQVSAIPSMAGSLVDAHRGLNHSDRKSGHKKLHWSSLYRSHRYSQTTSTPLDSK